MKRKISLMALAALTLTACTASAPKPSEADAAAPQDTAVAATPIVYFTSQITPEALVRIYDALGVKAHGRVAVKISTGERGGHHYLKPELIAPLVRAVDGTIVECNTAYGGSRASFAEHRKTIAEHGFDAIAPVVLMDQKEPGSEEVAEMRLPVRDTTHIRYTIVGAHMADYDFMINLAHFKGHTMGGFGGVLKNQSIGNASANGKAYIHTAGHQEVVEGLWSHVDDQDGFLESMAAAAQGVHDYFKAPGRDIIYIDVMNNMSVDCDCDAHPAAPLLKDIGILASTDPVALDKACLDLVFGHEESNGDDPRPLIERIQTRHGTHIIDHAAAIGLGSMSYHLVSLDE